MDVLIRNIDNSLLKTIDNLAKKKGMSRQKYLENYIKQLDNSLILQNEKKKINRYMYDVKKGIQITNQRMKYLEDGLDKLSSVLQVAIPELKKH